MAVELLYHLYQGTQSIFSTSTSVTAVFTIALSCLLAILWQSKHMPVKSAKSVAQAKQLPLPPGPWVLPIIGDTLRIMKTGLIDLSQERQKKYGPIHRTWLIGQRNVFVSDTASVRRILNGEHTIVEEEWPLAVERLLGLRSVAVMTFNDHLNMRKLMAPAFTPQALARGVPRLVELACEHCERWSRQEDIQGVQAIKAYTFHAAVELVLGFERSWVNEENLAVNQARFRAWTDAFTAIPYDLPGFRYKKAYQARRELLALIKENLAKMQAKLQDPSYTEADHHRTGIELALEASMPTSSSSSSSDDSHGPYGVDLETLADTSLNMLFAGHDTSASAIMLAMRHLKLQPHILQRLRQEQQEVVDQCQTDSSQQHQQALTEQQMSNMPYTTAIIKEVLRHRGIVSHVWRTALVDLEGWRLNLDLWKVMLDDPRWADQSNEFAPSKFNPDRWLTQEGMSGDVNTSWIPFGGGARKCMGYNFAMLEIKSILAILARSYDWSVDTKEDLSMNSALPTLSNGMPMKVWKLDVPLKSQNTVTKE